MVIVVERDGTLGIDMGTRSIHIERLKEGRMVERGIMRRLGRE